MIDTNSWGVSPSAFHVLYIVEESGSLLFIDKMLAMNISNLCVGCNSNTLHISKTSVGVMHVWSYSIIIKGYTIQLNIYYVLLIANHAILNLRSIAMAMCCTPFEINQAASYGLRWNCVAGCMQHLGTISGNWTTPHHTLILGRYYKHFAAPI